MYESSIFGHENTSKKSGKALKKGKFINRHSMFFLFQGHYFLDTVQIVQIKYMINLLLVLIGFDTGGNRDQMKLRAGRQT